MTSRLRTEDALGRPPERLTTAEQLAWAGQWIALELYNTRTLPLRLIAAIGPDVAACARQLRAQGLDVTRYEYVVLDRPYGPASAVAPLRGFAVD